MLLCCTGLSHLLTIGSVNCYLASYLYYYLFIIDPVLVTPWSLPLIFSVLIMYGGNTDPVYILEQQMFMCFINVLCLDLINTIFLYFH